jgi:hypothetical protein
MSSVSSKTRTGMSIVSLSYSKDNDLPGALIWHLGAT